MISPIDSGKRDAVEWQLLHSASCYFHSESKATSSLTTSLILVLHACFAFHRIQSPAQAVNPRVGAAKLLYQLDVRHSEAGTDFPPRLRHVTVSVKNGSAPWTLQHTRPHNLGETSFPPSLAQAGFGSTNGGLFGTSQHMKGAVEDARLRFGSQGYRRDSSRVLWCALIGDWGEHIEYSFTRSFTFELKSKKIESNWVSAFIIGK
eukprot:IDg21197t1